MKHEILAEIGLSKNEIEVYLKLLELKSATGVKVAKEAKLYKANVYGALERLVKKGLVTHYLKGNVKQFQAVDPDQIMNLLKEREAKLQKIMPELKMLQFGSQNSTDVAVFEGVNGIRKVLLDLVTNTKELFLLGAPRNLVKLIGEGWINNEWHKPRIANKIKYYHIVNEDYPVHRIKLIRKMPNTTIRFLKKEHNAPNSIFINDNGVAMIFLNPLIAIKIDNEEVAQSFKHYFKLLYENALKIAPQEK
jgi:sugar-specific transcriptional regulator TrmB